MTEYLGPRSGKMRRSAWKKRMQFDTSFSRALARAIRIASESES
jgi:hypothetical protein